MRVALLFTLAALSGCLQTGVQDTWRDGVTGSDIDESIQGKDVTLEIVLNEQPTDVVLTYWSPDTDASSVVLALHGSAGARWNHGPAVPGYSFAHAWLAHGYAVASLDYPGYGDSPDAGLQTMEELASVTAQVADALRQGTRETPPHAQVLGFGISMGGLLTQLTQAEYNSFEAIISAAWSYGGFDQAYQDCVWLQQGCPEDPLEIAFHVENMEPTMVDFLHDHPPSSQASTGSMSINAWAGCPVTPEAGPPGSGPPRIGTCAANEAFASRAHAVTQAITVPVLLLFGKEDRFWADVSSEEEYFSSAEVSKFMIPDTGHVVIWHLTHDEVMDHMIEWADRNLTKP